MNTTKKEKIMDAYLSAKFKIDDVLAELQKLSADHFNVAPDDVNWGHVGSLRHIVDLLREVRANATTIRS